MNLSLQLKKNNEFGLPIKTRPTFKITSRTFTDDESLLLFKN